MPEVPGSPYEPYPTVEPQIEMLRPGGLPEVPAAFGAATARAVSTFGGDVQQAGKEVFDRGLALRRMQIEGDTRDAATDWSNRMEGVKNAFTVKQGDAAGPDAMNATLAQINQERMAARAQVIAKWGPYGGQLFDDQTASMQRSFTREVGGWSAQQFRQGQRRSVDARIALAENRAQSNPYDDEAFNAGMAELRGGPGRAGLLAQRASLLDLDPDTAKLDADTAVARLTQSRIKGFAIRGDDQRAQDELDKAVKDKILVGDVADRTQAAIQTQVQRNFTYNKAVEAESRRAENAAVATDANRIFRQNVTADDQGNLIVNPRFMQQAAALTETHPIAENARPTETAMINWFNAKREQAEKPRRVVSSPEVADRLNARLFDPDNPLTLIETLKAESDAVQGRPGIDAKQGGLFRQIITARDQGSLKDPILKDTLAAVKNKLAWEALNSDDIGGTEAFARFGRAFYPGYIALSQAGRGMAVGALNMDDPNSLVSVALAAARNAPTLQDRLRALPAAQVPAPVTPPAVAPPPAAQPAPRPTIEMRKPGETASDYLIRTGHAAMPSPPMSQ